MAKNLAMSYQVNTLANYSFAVITTKEYEKELQTFFDIVIVDESLTGSFADKINIYKNTPFYETIFIDADSDITEDIGYAFDLFEKNASDISAIGRSFSISAKENGHVLTNETISYFQFTIGYEFNGGLYYFRKSIEADNCMSDIFEDIIPNYKKYGLKYIHNKMDDESIFCLAFLRNGMKVINDGRKIMRAFKDYDTFKTLQIEKDSKISFLDYGTRISPSIIHWLTCYTYSLKYATYNAKIYARYKNYNFLSTWAYLRYSQVIFIFKDKILKWIRQHFCKEYFQFTLKRIYKIMRRFL